MAEFSFVERPVSDTRRAARTDPAARLATD